MPEMPGRRLMIRKAAMLAFAFLFLLAASLMPDRVYQGWQEPIPF